MNSGYTILTIGGLVLMMVAAINANRMIVDTDVEPLESVQYSQAVALAEELLGEIRTKKFDENARDTTVLTVSQLTVLLGPEAGPERDSCIVPDLTNNLRSLIWYNDIDDYKGYSRIVRDADGVEYRLNVDVSYVTEDNLTPTSTRTYFKKITVTARNLTTEDSVTLSTIRTYY